MQQQDYVANFLIGKNVPGAKLRAVGNSQAHVCDRGERD